VFLELATVLLPLLGYFFCMIAVLTAAGGMMIGLFNTSTSRVSHYPHPPPVIESNFTATNGEPRLFMAAPETKEGLLTKNIEADSSTPSGWLLAVPLPPSHRRPPSAAHIPHIYEAAHAR
jgi:hypothetical protein